MQLYLPKPQLHRFTKTLQGWQRLQIHQRFNSAPRHGSATKMMAWHITSSTQKELSRYLLLHGAMTGGPEWDLVIPHFSERYHLLVPDLPLTQQLERHEN